MGSRDDPKHLLKAGANDVDVNLQVWSGIVFLRTSTRTPHASGTE